jgi:enoyl-CoA hydratase/carnithine racemase
VTAAEGVRSITEDGTCRITIDRPGTHNALTIADRVALARALAVADDDPECRVVVVTGAGENFCSGGDINEFAHRRGREEAESYGRTTAQLVFRTLRAMRTPTLARVRGAAAGAGMFLALGCDVVVADETAVFHAAHLRLGVVPDWGAVWLLPRLVGVARAKALLLTGGSIAAAEARRDGMIAECVPVEALDERIDWYCAKVATFPVRAIELTRAGLDRSLDVSLAEFLEWEAVGIGELMSGDEHAALVSEFLNRRNGS